MANLRDIRRRIKSVRGTQKITRAMKMVAAAKLRRSQEAIVASRPYALRMRALIGSLAARAEHGAHPLLRRNTASKRVVVVAITSDRGLCGAFNSNVVNETLRAMRERFAGDEVLVTAVGRKGAELLRRRGANVVKAVTDVQEQDPMAAASGVIGELAALFERGDVREIHCAYNEFKSAISQRVTIEPLLPFEPEAAADGPAVDYVYEPDASAVFERLLHQHLAVQMRRMLLESAASEQGARMTAMDSATRNAGEMIGELTLAYNRARQDAITKELIEVVSGAEAL